MKAPPDPPSSIADLLASTRPAAVWLRRLLLLAMILAGLSASRTALSYVTFSRLYQKDFIQEYLFARAALSGLNPYQPVSELGPRFLGRADIPLFPHPTPHPPPILFLALPFSLFPYEQAQVIWLIVEVVCLGAALWLLVKPWYSDLRVWQVALLILLTMPLLHLWEDLGLGQLMILLLVLLAGAWRAFRIGREVLGGALLGMACALKLIVWPVIVLLLIQRRWRAAFTASGVIGTSNLAAAAVLGLHELQYYYSTVSRLVWETYRTQEGNFSLSSIGWRMFDGIGSPGLSGVYAPPLISIPGLAYPTAIVMVGAWILLGLFWAARAKSFDTAFGMILCTSVLASPITWCHYLILLAVPFSNVVQQVRQLAFPRCYVYAFLLLLGVLSAPASLFHDAMSLFALPDQAHPQTQIIPFTASLIDLIPAAAVIALLFLLRQLDRKEDRAPAIADRAG